MSPQLPPLPDSSGVQQAPVAPPFSARARMQPGVIDLEGPKRMCARLANWAEQRFSLAHRLQARSTPAGSAGERPPLLLARAEASVESTISMADRAAGSVSSNPSPGIPSEAIRNAQEAPLPVRENGLSPPDLNAARDFATSQDARGLVPTVQRKLSRETDVASAGAPGQGAKGIDEAAARLPMAHTSPPTGEQVADGVAHAQPIRSDIAGALSSSGVPRTAVDDIQPLIGAAPADVGVTPSSAIEQASTGPARAATAGARSSGGGRPGRPDRHASCLDGCP